MPTCASAGARRSTPRSAAKGATERGLGFRHTSTADKNVAGAKDEVRDLTLKRGPKRPRRGPSTTRTWTRWPTALDKDVRIIVARPFIEHTMHNVIMTVAGRDTGPVGRSNPPRRHHISRALTTRPWTTAGATLFGPADMQLSANTQVKTIEGHYTGHFKAVVTKPQNVLVMRDVACAGYVAGCNTRWFAKGEDELFSADNAANAIQARLSFANDDTDRYASMLAFPCYEGQFNSGQLDTVMSVTTRLLPWEVNNQGLHASFPGGNEMYKAYNAALQLGQVHYGEDMKAAENQDFISQANSATL